MASIRVGLTQGSCPLPINRVICSSADGRVCGVLGCRLWWVLCCWNGGAPLLTPQVWETILLPFVFLFSGTCVPPIPKTRGAKSS